jgi:hypothetical protein
MVMLGVLLLLPAFATTVILHNASVTVSVRTPTVPSDNSDTVTFRAVVHVSVIDK